jgi:hypothetical protein
MRTATPRTALSPGESAACSGGVGSVLLALASALSRGPPHGSRIAVPSGARSQRQHELKREELGPGVGESLRYRP